MVLCYYVTMVLWKIMVLWTKLWYYTENYGTSIYEGKRNGRLPETKKLWFLLEKIGNIPK